VREGEGEREEGEGEREKREDENKLTDDNFSWAHLTVLR
jgi:hypothetical protein